MAQPLEDELAAITGPAAPQGVRRRADVSYTTEKPDYAKELDASFARVGSYAPAVTGLARQIGGDQEGAMADYRRSAAIEAEADSRDSNQSTDWRDIDGVGSALGFARKMAAQSVPDALMSLGAGGVARGLARRTAADVERRAIASRVAADIATPGVDTPLTRQVAAQQATARAATAGVAAQQRREAINDVAGEALERMPTAQRRIDRAGRAGAFVGAAAGLFPGMVAGSREQLEQTDQEGAAKIALGDAAAAALGAVPAERLLGRIAGNPAARQQIEAGAASLLQRAGKVAKEGATQAAVEGTTEAAQAAVQRAGHAWVNSNVSLLSREALDDYVANFVGGAVLGGSMGTAVEAGTQGAGALRDASRWAWDASGQARSAIRDRLAAIGARARGAGTDEGAEAPQKRAKAQPERSAGDMFSDARRILDGVANRGLDAAERFRERLSGIKADDDLDARTDAVMDRMQAATQRADGNPLGDGVVARAPSFTQKWMLSQVNPEFLARVPESDALRLGRILEKYAGNKELSPVESRTLARVVENPASGLTQDVLDTIVGIGPAVRDLDKRLSDTADADAPRMAQQRAPDTQEVTEADQQNAVADAIAAGEDASGVDVRDLNSGNSVQGAETPRPIDAMNNARQTLLALRERLGEGAAQDPAYGEAMAAGQMAREQARADIARNKGIITRNNGAADFYAKRKAEPDTVELLDKIDVTDGRGNLFQPQLLDLGTLIQRQQAAIRAEGTSADSVPAEQALMRGLAEAAQAGYRINPDTFSVGNIMVGGREILRITPKLRAQLRQDTAALANMASDYFAPVADSAELDAEFAATEREDDAMGESVIDSGVPEDARERVPREPPPGVQVRARGDIRNLDFVPDESVVSDVRANAPYAAQLTAARKAYAAAKTPRERAAVKRGLGIEIGTAEIQREYAAGNMSAARYEREMERLRAPDSDLPWIEDTLTLGGRERTIRIQPEALSARFVRRATRGDFDTASVTHRRADTEARKGKDKPDAAGALENKRAANKADRQVAARDAARSKAGVDPARPDVPNAKDNAPAASPGAAKFVSDMARDKAAGKHNVRNAKGGLVATVNNDGAKESRDESPTKTPATPNPKITPYQREAEGKWVNEILGMLGIKDVKLSVGVRTDRAQSGRYLPRTGRIELADDLRGVERQEVLLHELGHAIVYNEAAKLLGNTVDGVVDFFRGDDAKLVKAADKALYEDLRADFDAWRAGIKLGTPVLDLRASRGPVVRADNMRARLAERGRADMALRDLTDSQIEYELDFGEWLADNLAKALLAKREVTDAMTRVERFFAAIAMKIREVYDALTNQARAKPAPSVERWVEQMFNREAAAVRAVTGASVPVASAEAAAEAAAFSLASNDYQTQADALATAANRFNSAPRGPGSTFGLGTKVDPTAPPFEGANRIGKKRFKKGKPPREFAAMADYVRTVLRPKERQVLFDLFNQPAVHQRLQRVYAKRPDVLAAIDDAQTGMEARIAAGYLAWNAGKFNVGPKGRSVLFGIGSDLLAVMKLAGDGAVAQRLLTDIASGTVAQFRKNNRTYDARALVSRGRGPVQQALNKFGDLREKIWSPISRALESNGKRMFESGVPAMRQIAGLLYKPTGTTGSDRGMVREVVHRTAQFAERAASIMQDLQPNQQRRVLQLLQEQADDERLTAKITNKRHKNFGKNRYSPKVRRAVREARALMNEAFDYMDGAGVRVGYRKNFFPVLLDLRNERSKERLTALLLDPKFEDDIRAFFADGAPQKKDADDKVVPLADLVKRLVDGATGTGAPSKTNAGAPNFRGANFRVMEFIYRLGTPEQIKEFANLQTKNPAEAFARYLEPMVRRAEYARRFKDDGSGLDKLLSDMHKQGATDAQLREAREAVEAALGTYGSDLSPTLEAISPALAKRFSGPKTRATTQGLQAYQNTRLLPLALISSFVDPMGIAVRTGGDFATTWQGFKVGIKGLVNKDKRGELADMMKLLGASSDMATMEALQQGFGGAGNTTAARVNDFIFRWNGMAAWTRATRYMALTAGHHFLLKHAASTSPASKRYLRELGLQDGDIRADPSATTADGAPRQQVFLMDADMLKRAKPAQREADARVKSALMQFVDDAVLRPNSQQVPQWHSDPFMGLVTQYKAFSYAIYDQIMGRIDTELKNGNAKVLLAAGAYVPIVIAAEILRDVVQGDGEDKDDWEADDWLKLGVEKSGLYSPVFGAAEGVVDDVRNDRLPGSSAVGPTASQARNVTQALIGSRDLGKEFESALPGSAWYRKWNDGQATDLPDPS